MGYINLVHPDIAGEGADAVHIGQLSYVIGLCYLLRSLGHVVLLADCSVVPLASSAT